MTPESNTANNQDFEFPRVQHFTPRSQKFTQEFDVTDIIRDTGPINSEAGEQDLGNNPDQQDARGQAPYEKAGFLLDRYRTLHNFLKKSQSRLNEKMSENPDQVDAVARIIAKTPDKFPDAAAFEGKDSATTVENKTIAYSIAEIADYSRELKNISAELVDYIPLLESRLESLADDIRIMSEAADETPIEIGARTSEIRNKFAEQDRRIIQLDILLHQKKFNTARENEIIKNIGANSALDHSAAQAKLDQIVAGKKALNEQISSYGSLVKLLGEQVKITEEISDIQHIIAGGLDEMDPGAEIDNAFSNTMVA